MLNQVILVGRVHKIEKLEAASLITLCVSNSKTFGTEETYEDIPVQLSPSLIEAAGEHLVTDIILGVKGRIKAEATLCIVAEKISFVSADRE